MTAPDTDPGERVAKVIARSGVCSRREAEDLIRQGRVAVDGREVTEMGVRVTQDHRVTIDGEPLPAVEAARLYRYHKPDGVLTAARDPEGRRTIYDTLPQGLPRLMPVGRLDYTSEGLLLLTNDGALKRTLELPTTGWLRRYRARAYGRIDDAGLAVLKEGVTVAGVAYGPIHARLERQQGGNAWISLALREGKNREVRHVLEHLGLQVNRLIRTAYGPFQLGALDVRGVEEVPPKVLREQIGAKLAKGVVMPDPKARREFRQP